MSQENNTFTNFSDAMADAVEKAVAATLEDGYRTKDIYTEGTKLVNTEEMGAVVLGKL